MASSTFKIATVLATDPILLSWDAIGSHAYNMAAAKVLSLFRSAILSFNTLTSAQYAQWLAVCDINSDNSIYLPNITNATYTLNPNTFTGTVYGAFTVVYRYHLMGSRHSSGVYVYDTQILLYMSREYEIGGGGG